MSTYNWNDVVYELSPTTSYTDFYGDQPRTYMYEGASLIDLILLFPTLLLSIFWLFFVYKCQPCLTKALITITALQIFINCLVRIFKAAIISFVTYPWFSALFIASSVETTFYYTLFLQFTSSRLVFVFLRTSSNRFTHIIFVPFLLFALFLSVLNVNCNALLDSIPFYAYIFSFIGCLAMSIIIVIAIIAKCFESSRHDPILRLRLVLFFFIAISPTLFNSVISIMDVLFMSVGNTETFPVPYVIMTTYRYKAFELSPLCIQLAFFALFPDLKIWRTSEVTTAVTEKVTHKKGGSTQSPPVSSEASAVTDTESIPGEIQNKPPAASTDPSPPPAPSQSTDPKKTSTLSSLNTVPYLPGNYSSEFPAGSIVVHVQPLNYSY